MALPYATISQVEKELLKVKAELEEEIEEAGGSYSIVADEAEMEALDKKEGALAYNQEDHKFYICDGTNWSVWETGIPTITITSPHNSGNLSGDNLTIFQENYFKPMIVIKTITLNTFVILYKVNEDSNSARFSAIGGTGDSTNIISKIMNIHKNNNYFWTYYDMGNLEKQNNKKTSVQDNSSSDTYYPTTKAVYDFVNSFNHIPIINLPQAQGNTLSQDDLTILQNNADKPILLISNNTQVFSGLVIFNKTKTFTEDNETYSRFEMVDFYFNNNVYYNQTTIIQIAHSSGYWDFGGGATSENEQNKVSTFYEFNQNIDEKHYPSTQAVYQFALNGQEINVNLSTLDLSQTYTFTLTNDEYNKLCSTYHLRFQFDIDMDNFIHIYVKPQFILDTTQSSIKSSTIVEINNKQYIALITLNLSSQSNNATLSFQEIEGGGGGGASATRTKYHIEVADSNDHKAIIPIYKDDFDKYLIEMNQVGQQMATAQGLPWTTLNIIDDVKDLFDQMKGTQYSFGVDLAMNLLVKYAYESGENPVLQLPIQDDILANNDLTISNIASYDLITYSPSIILGQVKSIYNNVESSLLQDYVWFKVSLNYSGEQITIDSNATFTYTEEQVAGGSSSGGKLYQLDLQLTRYDNDGETVVKWGDSLTDQLPSGFSSELVLNYFPIRLLLSETKVEAFKAFINPIIDTFNSQAQTQIPHITDINSIVSLLNTYVIADFSLGRLFLDYLIQFSDTALLHYLMFGAEYSYNITSNTTGSILGLSSKNNNFEISSDYNPEQGVNHDCVYSVNNTCTLTEYGTSGGGGSTPSDSVGDNYLITFTITKNIQDPDTQQNVEKTDNCSVIVSEKLAKEANSEITSIPDMINTINNATSQQRIYAVATMTAFASSFTANLWYVEDGVVLSKTYQQITSVTQIPGTITSVSEFVCQNIPDKVGSSSGGEVATKKWYEYKLTEGSSGLNTHSFIVAKLSEEQQNELFTALSTALSQTISTPQDLINIYNQLKADDLSNSQNIYNQLVQVWMMLWTLSAVEFRTIYTSAGLGKIPVNLLDISSIFQDTASGNPDGDKITFDANSTLTITEETETVSGGSTTGSGVDYIQLHSNGANNHIIFTFEKGMMDTPTMVTDINNGITGLNTQLGLSIPAYTKLTDLPDIIAYIGNLSSSYMQAKVIFWSSMFSFISYCALSVKGQINGEICPISIEAIADSTDSIYTFAIKYLSANSNPFGYADWFSPTNWLSSEPLCLVNQLD